MKISSSFQIQTRALSFREGLHYCRRKTSCRHSTVLYRTAPRNSLPKKSFNSALTSTAAAGRLRHLFSMTQAPLLPAQPNVSQQLSYCVFTLHCFTEVGGVYYLSLPELSALICVDRELDTNLSAQQHSSQATRQHTVTTINKYYHDC